MLDTGNFVLIDEDLSLCGKVLVPTQVLNQGGQLVARFSEANYSSGRFMFTLQTTKRWKSCDVNVYQRFPNGFSKFCLLVNSNYIWAVDFR